MKEKEVVEEMKRRFDSLAVILHGSRATGHEREHSDWDFVLLVGKDSTSKGGRVAIRTENIEYSASVATDDIDIVQTFGSKLQGARVVFDTDEIGERLLARAAQVYKDGPTGITPEKKESLRLFLASKIDGMVDNKDEDVIFFRHLSIFYLRATNLWFELLQKEFSKPLYIALPIIKTKDPDFSAQLEVLASRATNEEKVLSAKKIQSRLFEL